MDNKNFAAAQKKAYKFNIIDFILIVIIIAAVSVLAYVILGNDVLSSGENVTIVYSIEMALVKNEYIPAIEKIVQGTPMTESVRFYNIGEVQSVKITDAYVNSMDLEAGVINQKPYPDYSKVVITVKAECKKEKVKYMVNGKNIMVGVQVHFRTPYFIGYGNCVSIEEVSEAANAG